MPDVCAAIGLAQIRKYSSVILKERKNIAEKYQHFFQSREWAQLPVMKEADRESCYHLFALRINDITEAQRDGIIEKIAKTGVSVNVHFIPMPMLTLFKNLGYDIVDFPVAYDNYSREISLPIYPQLTDEQIDYICKEVEQAYHKVLG